ncbi:hypothetical protein FRZ44_07140 [Hypericibacter terrae]|uniref:Uncharacterized protein n=1 Tax=Hypericibacter terrae TaxID=2602015 RepID=A0A5J6MGP5_9PROT|nr:hypothetical protein FRZ44_07140 [Hypericibacter terrae]
MPTDPTIIAALVSGVVAIGVATVTSIVSFSLQKDRLRAELKFEFSTEAALLELLSDERWQLRSFDAIHKRFRGLGADELRKSLIRAGALSFGDAAEEFWGLRDRNKERLG